MIGNFGSVSLKDVVGYKISANWTPNYGFQGYFYVYVWDMQNPQTAFGEAVTLGQDGAPTRGNLVLEDGVRTYTFNGIDLMSAQVGATRRYRYRLLEFKYDGGVINAANQATPVELQNSSPEKVALGGLKTDYQYALDQGAENLLGFRYRPASTGSNIVRFFGSAQQSELLLREDDCSQQ